MMLSLILIYLCFILLLCDCKAPKMYSISQQSKSHSRRRTKLAELAEKDPCSKSIWVFIKPKEMKIAKQKCEEAYNLFVGLPQSNQDSCLNAALPACRPLRECEDLLFYGCTFVCDGSAGSLISNELINEFGQFNEFEQDFTPRQEIKQLKDIVEEYSKGVQTKRKNFAKSKDGSSGSGSKSKKRKQKTETVSCTDDSFTQNTSR